MGVLLSTEDGLQHARSTIKQTSIVKTCFSLTPAGPQTGLEKSMPLFLEALVQKMAGTVSMKSRNTIAFASLYEGELNFSVFKVFSRTEV